MRVNEGFDTLVRAYKKMPDSAIKSWYFYFLFGMVETNIIKGSEF